VLLCHLHRPLQAHRRQHCPGGLVRASAPQHNDRLGFLCRRAQLHRARNRQGTHGFTALLGFFLSPISLYFSNLWVFVLEVGCLFDVLSDPEERNDLALEMPDKVSVLFKFWFCCQSTHPHFTCLFHPRFICFDRPRRFWGSWSKRRENGSIQTEETPTPRPA